MPVQLTVSFNRLCTPHSAIVDPAYREYFDGDPGLICRASEDPAMIKWPNRHMTQATKAQLAGALYDSREMGLIPDCKVVLLPDGTEFHIDDNLGGAK